ncbi:helix-turn-helix transcriptional regulator [Pedobacter foliorum]|uniref:helix-turn-helix transcriptional regulator n=1 Tax=Pedobacter foliorum TaxID=2739058 RepID=UPI001566FB68|nr:AraC family transcriptional regulator [Pedobacter foliorum]NRF41882.1 helix-turn-helix transcriptional regulator [Pedobacter foliorum]
MSAPVLHIKHYYALAPHWQQPMANDLGAELIEEKLLELPKSIGQGGSYFLEVIPGLSLLLADVTFHTPITFTRLATTDHFYLAYYDLSDEISSHIVEGTDHKIGYRSKLGMGFMDSQTESTLIPTLNERYYSLRLFMSKELLISLMGNSKPQNIIEALFDETKNTLFFYSHIDSSTRLLLKELKERSFNDPSFELHAKGTALKVLTHLIRRARNFEPIIQKLSSSDTTAILNTSQYLLDNLPLDFPGVTFLAELAGMSESKYKKLFTKIVKSSPKSFFLEEKLLLAQNLLQSGNFHSIREVALEVGYSKTGYFSEAYKKAFGTLPQEVFIKTTN